MTISFTNPRILFCQEWEESESGWGCRPDGVSLHSSLEDLAAFVSEYWSNMPEETPHEYSRPVGKPYHCTVSESLMEQVLNKPIGVRIWQHKLREPNNSITKIKE